MLDLKDGGAAQVVPLRARHAAVKHALLGVHQRICILAVHLRARSLWLHIITQNTDVHCKDLHETIQNHKMNTHDECMQYNLHGQSNCAPVYLEVA